MGHELKTWTPQAILKGGLRDDGCTRAQQEPDHLEERRKSSLGQRIV